jgi:hypothetical protein
MMSIIAPHSATLTEPAPFKRAFELVPLRHLRL